MKGKRAQKERGHGETEEKDELRTMTKEGRKSPSGTRESSESAVPDLNATLVRLTTLEAAKAEVVNRSAEVKSAVPQ